jgi:hypothetical protein
MRANHWLTGFCCFCLACAVRAVLGYPHSKSLFLATTQLVIFYLFVLFEGLISHCISIVYEAQNEGFMY